MGEMTRILASLDAGDKTASQNLFPLVYAELRHMAGLYMSRENPEHTLQPTALVNEAFLRLIKSELGDTPVSFINRQQFFFAASEAMRRILIDHARTKSRLKRGGGSHRLPLRNLAETLTDPVALLIVNEFLDLLATKWPRRAELVKLRLFAGCTIAECADLLGVSTSTAEDDWVYSRSWLGREWKKAEKKENPPGM